MNWGYIWMFLGLASFSLLGVFAKVAELKKCRPGALYLLLCAWSAMLAFAFTLVSIRHLRETPTPVLWVALPFGVTAALAGVAFQSGIRYGKLATSWLIINLSAAIPTLGSIVIYHEPVSMRKVLALCLIAASVLLLWRDKLEDERQAAAQEAGDCACGSG